MLRRLPIFAFLFALLLLACGDGRNSSSTPGAATAGKAFLYVSNTAANTITAFLIDNTTGVLLPVPGSPFLSTGDAPGRAAVNSAAHLLFVINQSSATLSSYRINADTGSLTLGSTISTGALPVSLVLHPTSNFVYVLSSDGVVSGFNFDADGIFIPLPRAPYSFGSAVANAQAIAIDPRAPFLFTTSEAGFGAFQIAADGSLTPALLPSRAAGVLPSGLAFNPVNDFLYSVDFSQGLLFGWRFTSVIGVNAGLTPLPATPRAAGLEPIWISIVPNGTFAYVGAGVGANGGIQAFSLALDGTPLPVVGSPFSAPPSVVQIAIDPSGRFLYTASPGVEPLVAGPAPGFVNAFSIESTGFLLPVSGSPFAVPTPGGVAIARF